MMRIIATGNEQRLAELQAKLEGTDAELVMVETAVEAAAQEPTAQDLVLDLNLDDQPENLLDYANLEGATVIGCAVKRSLAEMAASLNRPVQCNLYGMNFLPTFINRSRAELSHYNTEDVPQHLAKLDWEPAVVKDRVGMATPRVIFMIINEACYTLQEGTATIADIDLGMKLGTNYPHGPFEWANAIGIKDVYETLEAIYQDTHEERYNICPMLKTKHLKREGF